MSCSKENNKETYLSENGNWSSKNRTQIKYGKGLKRIMEFITQTYNGENIFVDKNNGKLINNLDFQQKKEYKCCNIL